MSHPFQESLKNIEQRLVELNKIVTSRQSQYTEDMFIDNDEFQRLMKISPGTANNWREQGLIAYSQINSKIYYKMKDVNKLLDDNYRPFKKK
ncbi:MAG: helix-turn-helix domain-containing protein [Bacteroidetes bacterium]|nr:helix-turn-helix domain-containing protein [Bacteroidota bacterium]